MRAQTATAQHLAEALQGGGLERVIYPGLEDHPQHALAMRQMGCGSTVLAIDTGSREAAFRFLNALEIVVISNNLGDAKSIATHPATTTHQRLSPEQRQGLGIGDGLIRLSVGIEDTGDLVADIQQALDVA